jgi:hypothetical protein
LRRPAVLHGEIERLLRDRRAQRFVDDFVGQWLRLREIAANDPDRKLYPEFNPYLQDSMVAETRAYFRKMLADDLDASHLVRSDFVTVNEKLATHYGIAGVAGTRMRPVPLPADCPRGGFLTQAAILKITANGTTTSPVPRGAFVLDRLLGQPPEPPPANIAAIEPDVRGATTIREQLAKHRDHAVCASCHVKIDPPGFALESFDVIGGFRSRYRSIGEGDPAQRGAIDPFIPIGFRLGPPVDSTGTLPDGRDFAGIREYQALLAENSERLLKNLAERLTIYATGRDVRFSDRAAIAEIVRRTQADGGGLRSLIHHVIGSPLFTGADAQIPRPAGGPVASAALASHPKQPLPRMLMTPVLPPLASFAMRPVVAESAPSTDPPRIDPAHTLTLRVTGLFMPEQVAVFRPLLNGIPEVKLQDVDYDTAQATFAYAPQCQLFKSATADQITERLAQRVRQLPGSTFSVEPLGTLPHEQLERVEIPIVGLDCPACSLAVHNILMRVEGVEHATASFHDGQATAWIDPARTDRDKLIEALRQRQVTLGP